MGMRVVFCGTPPFAVPSLEALYSEAFDLALVVTQPDRPSGRGLQLTASAVKRAAMNLELPVEQPEAIKNNREFEEHLRELQPDAIVVVGYGRIIPPWMLRLPAYGNINVHASLLPKYRGAAPIQWAIANGETATGVTTMQLNEGLDTGDILLQSQELIRPEDTAVTLAPRLAKLGADLLVDTLRGFEKQTLGPTPQDHAQATLAPILKKEDGLIDFNRAATEICNRLRGFQPWPGAYTQFRGKNLKVVAARPTNPIAGLAPGELRAIEGKLLVGSGKGTALELLEVQPEGKKAMQAHVFLSGHRPQPGEKLG
jgi:methionyl-tRNA formyltransferase